MKIERDGISGDVLPEDYLELSGDVVVRNLEGLIEALSEMNKEDFKLHVYGKQNDFAEWILEGFWDEDLAGKILDVRDKGKMILLLRRALMASKEKEKLKIGKAWKSCDILKKISELE